jgi:hypothetical protein
MKTHMVAIIIALSFVVGVSLFLRSTTLFAQSRTQAQNASIAPWINAVKPSTAPSRQPSKTRPPSHTRQPSNTRVPTRRPSFTRIPTHTRIFTKTKTKTKTKTRTRTRTRTHTRTSTRTPVITSTPTSTPTIEPTSTPTSTPTIEPTSTPTPIALSASDTIEFYNESVIDWKVNVNGVLRGADPTLAMQKGETYTINVTNGWSHPLFLSTDGTTGSEYTSGVSPTGGATTLLTFTVPSDAPSQLFYVCGNHSGMQGIIVITP